MKIHELGIQTRRSIEAYGSVNVFVSHLLQVEQEAVISLMHVGPNGLVGYHQAASPQLFVVLQGQGWVRGEGPEKTAIQAGQAAFWLRGEWHESGSQEGMTAIIIEGPDLDPDRLPGV